MKFLLHFKKHTSKLGDLKFVAVDVRLQNGDGVFRTVKIKIHELVKYELK